ncbi:hypothetical protein ACJIZ3_005205 [Penstemon smallii]|uniref:Uncharacterized protein n=1 Tax=Penstemon smallii TaxID=265156 RepID=A0ABD3S480_9LAMI
MQIVSDIRKVWAHIHIHINKVFNFQASGQKGKDKKKCICARYMLLDQGLSDITTC